MNQLSVLELLATQTWQIAISILAVVLLNRTIAQKRPHLKRILWGVILVKCLVPPLCSTFCSPLSWLSCVGESIASSWDSKQRPPMMKSLKRDDGYRIIDDDEFQAMQTDTSHTEHQTSALSHWIVELRLATDQISATITNVEWQTWLVVAWFASLLTLGGISAIRYRKFVRRLERYPRVSNPLVDAIAERLITNQVHYRSTKARDYRATLSSDSAPHPPSPSPQKTGTRGGKNRYGVRWLSFVRSVSIEVIRGPIGPAVVGFFKPRIILPECVIKTLNQAELEALILHELIHVRRGDMLWSVAQMIADAMWWFHPMWWYARRRMNMDFELSCDEETLARTSLAPSAYARCLLQVLEQKQQLLLAPHCPGVKPVEVTQERLESIMQARHGCHRRSPFWLNLIFLAGCFLLVPGASIGLHGLENKDQEAESDSKPAASETNQESIAKEYDVASLLERLCKETRTEKEQAAEELIIRLIKQPRVFSFNSPDAATNAKVPAPVVHASSAEPRLDDAPARIENGTLYAVGTAEFHTQLQEKIARYRENGFVQILAEIVVIRFPDGYNIGIEGPDISPEDRERGIVFIDSTLADRFIASVPDNGNKNCEIVSRPKVLFNNGTSFNVSTETDDIKTIRKLQCVGKVALLESGKFDVEFELELSKQDRETEEDDTNKNKLPSPITRVSVSTCVQLATDKSLVLRTPTGKQSAFGGHMIFVKVKCVVPSFERSKVTPAVSKNERSHEDDTSIRLASATHETASKPASSHLPSIAIHALPISRYWQTPERYTFDYHFSPPSTIADNLSRVADRQGSKDFKTLEAELRKVGYDAYITGDVNFQLPASASDSNGVEIAGKRLKVMMSQGSMLQCGFGRFTLSTVSSTNTQDFDFSRFSKAEFDGNVLWTNRAGSIVAQSIKIDNNLVILKGNVNIVDRQRFSAKADRVLFDSETYSLGSSLSGKATLTVFDSSKEPQVVKADRIQFNLATKEIQTDPAE